jgi:hypothetical protein
VSRDAVNGIRRNGRSDVRGDLYTRYVLNYGTDDVTEFYAELLKRISLPYKELDISRRTDREMMDDLRIRTCIMLDVSELALTLCEAKLIEVCTVSAICGQQRLEIQRQEPQTALDRVRVSNVRSACPCLFRELEN